MPGKKRKNYKMNIFEGSPEEDLEIQDREIDYQKEQEEIEKCSVTSSGLALMLLIILLFGG